MATLKTQGTELYILDETNSGSEVQKIGQITGFSGVGGTAGEITATNFDSTAQEFVTGLKDNGTISINLDWDPQDGSHQTLDSLVNLDWDPQDGSHQTLDSLVGGANKRFFIACSESSTDPTFSSTFTLPTDRTTLDFNGGVLSFQKDASTDDIWRGSVSIRVSGDITITPAV